MPETILDQLEKKLATITDQAEQVDTINRLAERFQHVDPIQMKQFATQAYELATTGRFANTPYTYGVATSLKITAMALTAEGRYEQALTMLLDAQELTSTLSDDHGTLMADIWGGIGRCYSALSNYPQAIQAHLQQLKLSQQHDGSREMFRAYVGLGIAYFELGQIEEALSYEQQALKIAEALQNPVYLNLILNNLANNYNSIGDYDQAVQLAQRALEVNDEDEARLIRLFILNTLAEAYLGRHEIDHALELLEPIFEQLHELPYKDVLQHTHMLMGKANMLLEEPETAVAYFQEGLEIAHELGSKTLIYEAHKALSEVYERTEQWAESLHHYKQFHEIREALFNIHADQRLKSIEATYRTEAARSQANQLQSQNTELAQTVAERTKALQLALNRERQLKQELSQAFARESELSQLKSQIITTVSHEFRTPLTIINTSNSLLYKQYERISEEKRAELYKRIQESIFYLSDLLQDVSMVDDMQNQKVQISNNRYTFSNLCWALADYLQVELSHPSNLQFAYDETDNTAVQTDLSLFKQILFDLLSNAIKYASSDTPILTTLHIDGRQMVATIIDSGIGIPEEEQEQIFDLFYRASNVETQRGIGLGLFIARRLATALGGTITADSPGINQGSTFTLTIPLRPTANPSKT